MATADLQLGSEDVDVGDEVEEGELALELPQTDSIHAWSVGVGDRPRATLAAAWSTLRIGQDLHRR